MVTGNSVCVWVCCSLVNYHVHVSDTSFGSFLNKQRNFHGTLSSHAHSVCQQTQISSFDLYPIFRPFFLFTYTFVVALFQTHQLEHNPQFCSKKSAPFSLRKMQILGPVEANPSTNDLNRLNKQ